jgi:hypothetical protein
MPHFRRWLGVLMSMGLALSAQAEAADTTGWPADLRPAALEDFRGAVQDRRMVRMEIVHITSLTLTITQLDSSMFDGMVDGEVYAKQPDVDCYADLDDKRRSGILSEFDKYPVSFRWNLDDIDWRILMLDAKGRVWHRIYIGRIYSNASNVLMVVDGQAMNVDRRFVDFLNDDQTLNRCHF